ncbi:hypothetical protein B0A49_00063 [Cryomyces minteri]|uniref:Cytochrome P450 n=1 Tax=Cryomyces minteri TaxID=331657 RepID=A0A4U0Y2X6_9PEZI|nr:hypothetical protein B0A49_00063 [Cryomyces minteri]
MLLYALVAVLFVGFVVRRLSLRSKLPKGTKWLPGPKGVPGIGRVWDIPRAHSYKRFKQWADQFGPIYQINVFGVNHVWVSTDKIATDLLVKRGTIYSDRPPINQLESSKTAPEYLPLLGYNDVWKRQRKFVTQIMSQSARSAHLNLPLHESYQFLAELLKDPQRYEKLMEDYTGRVISRLAFGDVSVHPEVAIHSHGLLKAISPGAHLTNIIPALKRLPAFISPWKKEERARHAYERGFFLQMHKLVSGKVETGTALSSYMKTFLEKKDDTGMDDMEGAYVVWNGRIGGRPHHGFCSHDAEIDSVCGDRMPEPSDSPQMPVLRAVIKEIMRWRPITPSSIPHESTEDDIYEGYFIPKGTHVHPSQWAITRDEEMYPDPEVFNPSRWLEAKYPSYQEPLTQYPNIRNFTTFGYGRCICQGMGLVEAEFFVGIGGMAWAANISKKRDALGREIAVPAHDYTSLLISRPRPFQFDLKPRTEKREQQVWDNYFAAKRQEAMSSATDGMIAGIRDPGFGLEKTSFSPGEPIAAAA